jgi:IS30 family transposase
MEYYTHLISDERVRLSIIKQERFSVPQIARKLNRSPSKISRELRRDQAPPGHYWSDTEEQLSKAGRRRGCKLNHFKALSSFVIERLTCHLWLPEQIAD